jgi:hypothetical protein
MDPKEKERAETLEWVNVWENGLILYYSV